MAEMGTSALPRVPDTARMAEVDRGAAVPTSVPVGASTLWVPAPCQIQYGRVHLVLVIPRRRRSADGRPLLLSAQVTPALGTGADPFLVSCESWAFWGTMKSAARLRSMMPISSDT